MGDVVELECAVYGEGTMLPVKIALDEKVRALQKSIVDANKDVNPRFNVDPAKVTLYLARQKKESSWLESDLTLESFLKKGQSDTQYVEMIPNWTLDDEDYFKKGFTPGSREIHILVQLPPRQQEVDTSSRYKPTDSKTPQEIETNQARRNG